MFAMATPRSEATVCNYRSSYTENNLPLLLTERCMKRYE